MNTNMITLADSYPEFNPTGIVNAGIYKVTQIHTLTTDVNMNEGVVLIFSGGKIVGNKKITGNNTQIVAPLMQIFATTLTFSGIWNIDKAYPEWFGAKPSVGTSFIDCSLAINKAIELKQVGEVYISRGKYYIANPIRMKSGIVLCGEKSIGRDSLEYSSSTICIAPDSMSNFSATNNFAIIVNIAITSSSASWIKSYPTPITAIRNLYFFNESVENASIRGVFFAGAIEICYCRWVNFAQAVASLSSVYADCKNIQDCQYDNNLLFQGTNSAYMPTTLYYAFDLQGLGDNLTFRRNHIIAQSSNSDMYAYKGLIVSRSNGGEICNNIINAPTLLKDSKAILFSNNHMEGDNTQLTIQRSIVSVCDNYFEKGSKPCICFQEGASNYDLSIVSLRNNAFLFYENETTPNEYDIQTDGKNSLTISNTFRYWVRRNMITKTYPYGITMCDENGNSIEAYNAYSYLLSTNCVIKVSSIGNKLYILKQNVVDTANTITFNAVVNSNVKWELMKNGICYIGEFSYYMYVVWDKKRHINSNRYPLVNYKKVTIAASGSEAKPSGVLITINWAEVVGYQFMIRFVRKSPDGEFAYVDVPIVGSRYVYDNGNNICGFPWINISTESSAEISGIAPYGSLLFCGNNIVCKSIESPIGLPNWTDGDIVYNFGPNVNGAIYVRQNNSWFSK